MTLKRLSALSLATLVLIYSAQVRADDTRLESCNASSDDSIPQLPFIPGNPKIDGLADDAYWRDGLKIPINVETRPAENVAAPVDGHVILAENGRTLFVAFIANDPNPDQIRAYLRDRDSAWQDDFVGVVLDTFNDERQAYEFFANPLGAQMDLSINDITGNEDDSWDAIWDSSGRITANGYEVEMAIPLQQLRFPAGDGAKTWGIDVLRFYPRSVRHRISNVAQDRDVNCYLCQLPKIQGFACTEPGRNLVVAPSATVVRSESRDDPATEPLSSADVNFEPSLDVRWGASPEMTLIGTINPDFSQVEADVAQLNVNNTFALFFPETRPFFLDGASNFESPNRVIFSRTVASPDIGAKALIRRGIHNLSVFAAQDTVTNLLFPGAQGSDTEVLEQDNTTMATRYRADIGDNASLGAVATLREGDDYSNRVVGMDGRLRLNDSHTFLFQQLLSQTRYPDAVIEDFEQPEDRFTGQVTTASYRYSTRNLTLRAAYEDFDKDFRADNGFMPRVDAQRWIFGGNRTWYPEDRFLNRITFGGDWDINHRDDGRLQEKEWEAFLFAEGPWQTFAELSYGFRDRLFDEVLFREYFRGLFAETRPFGGAQFALYLESGDQIDFANTRLGEIRRINPRFTLQLGRHLQVRVRHSFTELDSLDGQRVFSAHLTDARVTWQFNNRSLLRLVVQHQDVNRDTRQYVDDDVESRSRSLSTQLLYSYKVNPQTVVFLGYSDGAEDGDVLTRFEKTNRTLFAKVGYAWLP
ncbi:MAG: DUF5916 domain-containing protein [Gammaproteobacteria bacterium]